MRGTWTGSSWLRIGTGGGHFWLWYWTFGFHKMRGISWLTENRLASQEGHLLHGVRHFELIYCRVRVMDSVRRFASRLSTCLNVRKFARPTLWIASRRIATTPSVYWLQNVISNAGFVCLQHRESTLALYFDCVDEGDEPFSLAIQYIVCLVT
jgi:hypothetical protein